MKHLINMRRASALRYGMVAALAVLGVAWGQTPASAAELRGWSCSIDLAANGSGGSGTGTCVDQDGHPHANVQVELGIASYETGSCNDAEQYVATGTLEVLDPTAGVDETVGVTLRGHALEQTGTIDLDNGATGPVRYEDSGTAYVVARCRFAGGETWATLHASFGATADEAYKAPDATLDAAAAAADQLNPSSTTQDAADALVDGINLVKGVKTAAGGCAFDLQGRLTPQQRSETTDEIGYDQATCTIELLVNVADEVAVPDANAGEGGSGDPLDPTAALPCSGRSACSTNYKYIQWEYKVWYTDPVDIAVTNHIQQMGWHYGNGCVHNPIDINEWDRWNSDSTWWLRSKDSYADASCGSTYISAYRHFQNDYFCAFTHTHLKYDRQVLLGHTNGDAGYSIHVEKQGYCQGALHFHDKLTRTA